MTPGRVSRTVVADKAALIRRLLDEAGTLPLDDLDAFTRDPRMVAAGESYLRRAIEALLDIARHVLAKGFAQGAAEYAEVARQLGEVRVVSPAQAERLVRMAGYRNRLVHVYDQVTPRELYELLVRRRGTSRRRWARSSTGWPRTPPMSPTPSEPGGLARSAPAPP